MLSRTTIDQLMTKEESYAQRRQLFKNIWETAMHLEDTAGDIMSKPKVVKTLRMDEIDKCPIGKTKKQRIKNLRHVCNRILDFCDRQDADDQFYQQKASEENKEPQEKTDTKHKKLKRTRKKIKKAKSLFAPQTNNTVARVTTSERRQNFLDQGEAETSRRASPIKAKRKKITAKSVIMKKSKAAKSKYKSEPKVLRVYIKDDVPTEATVPRRKVIKKKRAKKKKISNLTTMSQL